MAPVQTRREGGREGEREGEKEGGREGANERGREGGRERRKAYSLILSSLYRANEIAGDLFGLQG